MKQPIFLWRLRWGEIKRVECTKVTACYVWPADPGIWGGQRGTRL